MAHETPRWKTSPSVFCNDLITVEFQRMLAARKSRANNFRDHDEYSRMHYRSWLPSINPDSGAWMISAGPTNYAVMAKKRLYPGTAQHSTAQHSAAHSSSCGRPAQSTHTPVALEHSLTAYHNR